MPLAPKSNRWGLWSAEESSTECSRAGTLLQPWNGWVGSNPDFLPVLLGERLHWDLFPKRDADAGSLLLFLATHVSLSRLAENQAAVRVPIIARGCYQAPEATCRYSSTQEQCANTVTLTLRDACVTPHAFEMCAPWQKSHQLKGQPLWLFLPSSS